MQQPPSAAAGLEALVEAQRPRPDRLPALQPIVGELAEALAARFTQLAGEDARLRVEAIEMRDPADCLATAGPGAALGRFACLPEAGVGLLHVEAQVIRPLIDVALGGSGMAAVDARPPSAIEVRLSERLLRQLVAELGGTFGAVGLGCRFEGLERRRPPTTAGRTVASLRLAFRVATRGRDGLVEILLPGAAVDRLRQAAAGSAAPARETWTRRLRNGVMAAEAELEAVLHEGMIGLGLARELRPGRTLPLGLRPDAPIGLRCGDVGLARGAVASRDGRLVVSLDPPPIDTGTGP